jgi:sensor histidine kinase YesM
VISPAAFRRVCGGFWFRVGGVSVAAALVVTLLAAVFGGVPVRVTLPRALVHSLSMGGLAGFTLSRVVRRLRGRSATARWAVLIPTLAALAVTGSLIACGVLGPFDLTHGRSFWTCYASGFWINALITGTLSIGMLFYESQRAQLAAITLALRTKELEHERAQTAALEARLSSLESRLHPHFLFNTLNAISALIHDDPDQAERTVERLAALLRFSLDATERGMVPLADELKIVTDYLEIEKTRLDERLAYTVEASPELAAFEVPPLVVQTLVENSVKHAIAARSSGGRIRVEVSVNGANVVISVWDDGPGFTPAAMLPGHGLENLQSRLAARFGDAARFDVSRRDGGTLVTVAVPKAGSARR